MCLSPEEQDSIRALSGEADETVTLSKTLYNAVVSKSDPNMKAVKVSDLERSHRAQLKPPPVPSFESGHKD